MLERYKHVENIKLIVAVLVFLGLFIGSTFAYYRTIDHIDNDFETSKYKTEANEVFTSPTNWKPGDTTPKELTVTNNGDICENVRVSYEEKWEDKDGNIITPPHSLTTITFDNQMEWVGEGGYYYYNSDLQPGETTSSLLESVSYNVNIPNDYTCETSGNTSKCTKAGGKFAGATYSLVFNIETVECNAAKKVWNVDPKTITPYAKFDKGEIVNVKIKKAMGLSNPTTSTRAQGDNIYERIVFGIDESTESALITYCEDSPNLCQIVSAPDSPYAIYAYYNNSVYRKLVFYTAAGRVSLNEDASHMLEGFRSTTPGFGFLNYVNTSNTTNLDCFFKNADLVIVGGISSWDVSHVISMDSIFYGCRYLHDLDSIENWQTTSLVNLNNAFRGCENLNAASLQPIANWDVSNVKYMSGTFRDDIILESLSPLANWQTTSLQDLSQTFYGMEQLTTAGLAGISNWDVSKVETMNQMMRNCTTVTNLSNLSSWNTSSLRNIGSTFRNMTALTSIAGLSNWDVSSVWYMKNTFEDDTNLTAVTGINNWDVRSVMYTANTLEDNGFYYMFARVPNTPTFSKRSGTWQTNGSYVPRNKVYVAQGVPV